MLCLMAVCILSLIPAAADEYEYYSFEGVGEYDAILFLDSGDAAVALAAIDSQYGVGTSNINIFGPVASKLPYGVHYVYWRDGQYQYKFAYSADLVYEGGEFAAPSATVITYTTSTGYQSQATYVVSTERNFSLDPANYLVWSDLGDYPTLFERGEADGTQLTNIMLASFGIFVLFERIVRSCKR